MTPLALTPGPLVVIYSLHGHDFWRASRSAPAAARHSKAELVPAAEESPCAPLSVSDGEAS